MVTSPDSAGWRSACSTDCLNSGASSRNSTPRWAREIAPGRMKPLPPPMIAGHRRAVVRRDERRAGHQGPRPGQDAQQRLDRRHLQGVPGLERGQQTGQPLGQHRLAGARRTDHEQVVPTRRGDLQREPRLVLARRRHAGRARPPGRSPARRPRPARPRRPRPRPATGSGRPARPACRAGSTRHPGHERRLGGVVGRHHHRRRRRAAPRPSPPAAPRARAAPTRPAPARRCAPSAPRPAAGTRPAAASTAIAIGRSKPLPALGIDAGDRLTVSRRLGTDTPEFAAAALIRSGRLLARRVGQAADHELRQPLHQVRLDVDQGTLQPGQRHRPGAPQLHVATATRCSSLRRARPGPQHPDHVHPHVDHVAHLPGVLGQPARRQPPQPRRLAPGHRLDRVTERRAPGGS